MQRIIQRLYILSLKFRFTLRKKKTSNILFDFKIKEKHNLPLSKEMFLIIYLLFFFLKHFIFINFVSKFTF